MIRIRHAQPQLGRQRFVGIDFRDGTAEVESLDPIVEQTLLQHGYTIEQELDEVEPVPEVSDKPKTSKPRGRKPSVEIKDEAPADCDGPALPEPFVQQAWAGDYPEIQGE